MQLHEDEVSFNATLIQLLKKDFAKDLSVFESDLPTDEHGVNVAQIFAQIRHEVREISGFEVIDDCALGTFSFSKYLMWKDLVDRTEQLKNNRVVRHLIENPDQVFESANGMIPKASEVDTRFEPKDIFHLLPADSSQLAAVMAASAGQDFVLIGPPGTGKSQTIANIICQCLATNKTVLFVAEKTAALEVVHRRLRQHGLGDCCIELHSNKAERKAFLEQLENSWNNNRDPETSEWLDVNERLKIRRDELNAYVANIHAVQPNGMTAYEAFGICAKGFGLPEIKFDWDDSVRHDEDAYRNLQTTVTGLAENHEAVVTDVPLPMISKTDWSMGWEQELLESTSELESATAHLEKSLSAFAQSVGIPTVKDGSIQEQEQLKQLAAALVESANENMQMLFNKQFAKFPEAANALEATIDEHRSATISLSSTFESSLDRIPIDELDLQWRQATSSFWPMSWFAKRKVSKLLQTYSDNPTQKSNPTIDLVALRTIRAKREEIKTNPLAGQTRHWNELETDIKKLRLQVKQASQLRSAISAIGKQHDATQQISKAVHPHIDGKQSDSQLFTVAQQFLTSSREHSDSLKKF